MSTRWFPVILLQLVCLTRDEIDQLQSQLYANIRYVTNKHVNIESDYIRKYEEDYTPVMKYNALCWATIFTQWKKYWFKNHWSAYLWSGKWKRISAADKVLWPMGLIENRSSLWKIPISPFISRKVLAEKYFTNLKTSACYVLWSMKRIITIFEDS